MESLEQLFFRLGIPTYDTDIVINIPVSPSNLIDISKITQTDIGWIYGVSIDADSVDSQNNTLITTTQAQNLYIQWRNGTIDFAPESRLDTYLSVYAGVPVIRPTKYYPMNIPATFADRGEGGAAQHFDISTSKISNPTGIISPLAPASPIVIRIKLWFITTAAATKLAKHGYFEIDHPRHHPPGHRASANHPAHRMEPIHHS